MRKRNAIMILAVVILLVAVLGYVGCGGCNNEEAVPTAVPTVTDVLKEATKLPEEEVIPTVEPSMTVAPVVTPTSEPSATETPTSTPVPTATAIPGPTVTSVPTSTPTPSQEQTFTPTPVLTDMPTLEPTSAPKPTATPTLTSTPTPTPVKGIEAGDYVTFGSYEQDADESNGKEPIEWLVLEVKDGKAFLISKYCLDGHKYHSHKFVNDDPVAGVPVEVTWETSDLRAWLGSEFLNTAFTAEEQESIILTTVKNPDNTKHNVEGGNDTKDKVYLLSSEEALYYFGNAKWEGGSIGWRNEKSLAFPTEYAKTRNIGYKENSRFWYEKYANWWLRSPGMGTNWGTYVASAGILMDDGGYVTGTNAIRPVLWLDVESAEVAEVE